MALADYASPIDDRENPLLAAACASTACSSSPAAAATACATGCSTLQWSYPQRAVRLHGAARRSNGGSSSWRCAAVARTGARARRARRRRRLEHQGDAAGATAATRSTTSPCFRTWATADWPSAPRCARRWSERRSQLAARTISASGPAFDEPAMRAALRRQALAVSRAGRTSRTPPRTLIADDKVVLWFQGRMEYGPRALGHRSVLARPDRPALRDRINLLLKRRVWYQPFCPSLLESDARAAVRRLRRAAQSPHDDGVHGGAALPRRWRASSTSTARAVRRWCATTRRDAFADLLRAVRRRAGHRRGAQHVAQHPRRAAGLHTRTEARRVFRQRRRCARARAVSRRAASGVIDQNSR